jgi:hypothetical protein
MTSIRLWHSYIGLFIAPSVLFFTLTGAAQLFSLHEAHGDYHPPALVERLSSVHKDQVFVLGDHHDHGPPAPEGGTAKPDADDAGDKPRPATLALKVFFLVVALCLALSSSFGLWIGLTHPRRKRVSWSLVAAGTLIPVGLLLL